MKISVKKHVGESTVEKHSIIAAPDVVCPSVTTDYLIYNILI